MKIKTDRIRTSFAGVIAACLCLVACGTGTVQRSIPGGFTSSDGFDVGMDTLSPVANDYFDKAPFKFEGTLKKLHFKYLEAE